MTELFLPRLLLLTDRHQTTRPLTEVIAEAIAGGIRLVILREKDLPAAAREDLAAQIAEQLKAVSGQLVLASTAGPARAAGPAHHGQHLTATEAWPRPAQQQSPGDNSAADLLGRSCHGLAEVEAAAAAGASYVTLSPVFATRSKPGYGPPLGPGVFGHPVCRKIPVYALGGLETPERVERCVRAGATGAAVMGALMRAADPADLAARMLRAATP